MSDFLANLPTDPEPLGIERDLTIRAVQLRMGDNLEQWYPILTPEQIADLCSQKVNQEHNKWNDAIGTPSEGEELADKVISECAYASKRGIDLQSEIEKKLAIVSARTDQAERDRQRGIATPEPPTLRPGATVRVKADTKSINGLNLPAGQLLRVTSHSETMITGRIGEHGEGLVVTIKVGDVEVDRKGG